MGKPPCECFCVLMNTISFIFVMESLRSGKLVLSVPYSYLSIILFFILSFLHLPVCPIGCNLKSLGMAHEAQLLITIGSGGVRSVGMFKVKSRKVIKGTDYPFVWVKKHLPYDSKKRGGVVPPWSP